MVINKENSGINGNEYVRLELDDKTIIENLSVKSSALLDSSSASISSTNIKNISFDVSGDNSVNLALSKKVTITREGNIIAIVNFVDASNADIGFSVFVVKDSITSKITLDFAKATGNKFIANFNPDCITEETQFINEIITQFENTIAIPGMTKTDEPEKFTVTFIDNGNQIQINYEDNVIYDSCYNREYTCSGSLPYEPNKQWLLKFTFQRCTVDKKYSVIVAKTSTIVQSVPEVTSKETIKVASESIYQCKIMTPNAYICNNNDNVIFNNAQYVSNGATAIYFSRFSRELVTQNIGYVEYAKLIGWQPENDLQTGIYCNVYTEADANWLNAMSNYFNQDSPFKDLYINGPDLHPVARPIVITMDPRSENGGSFAENEKYHTVRIIYDTDCSNLYLCEMNTDEGECIDKLYPFVPPTIAGQTFEGMYIDIDGTEIQIIDSVGTSTIDSDPNKELLKDVNRDLTAYAKYTST